MSAVADQAAFLRAAQAAGRGVARALLVAVAGSAPLEAGSAMLIDEDGGIEGSLTGGCVESAVVVEAERVLAGGPPVERSYGIADDLAGTAGLTCGGTVRVFVHRLAGRHALAAAAASEVAAQGRPASLATLLDGEGAGGVLALLDGEASGSAGGGPSLDRAIARDARGMLDQGVSAIRRYGADGAMLGAEVRVHVRSFARAPRMAIVGANDFSAALAPLAAALGYAVTVCDPRERFVRAPRFARAAEVVVGWPVEALSRHPPGPRDAVVVVTHDPKLDVPALEAALATGAGYVGALGSRRTTAERAARLRAAGVPEAQSDRIHAPCGLDIGGRTPEEVAVSILAEIVATRAGRTGGPLRHAHGTIHGATRRTAGAVVE